MPAKKPHERAEEALRGFMETDPKKVKEAKERENERGINWRGAQAMLRLKGKTGGEYFNVTCEECGHYVRLSDLRWVGGVPHVKATCGECDESWDFKLHGPTWMDVVHPVPE